MVKKFVFIYFLFCLIFQSGCQSVINPRQGEFDRPGVDNRTILALQNASVISGDTISGSVIDERERDEAIGVVIEERSKRKKWIWILVGAVIAGIITTVAIIADGDGNGGEVPSPDDKPDDDIIAPPEI